MELVMIAFIAVNAVPLVAYLNKTPFVTVTFMHTKPLCRHSSPFQKPPSFPPTNCRGVHLSRYRARHSNTSRAKMFHCNETNFTS